MMQYSCAAVPDLQTAIFLHTRGWLPEHVKLVMVPHGTKEFHLPVRADYPFFIEQPINETSTFTTLRVQIENFGFISAGFDFENQIMVVTKEQE